MAGEITKIVQDALDKASSRLTEEQKELNHFVETSAAIEA